eukprot:TRINITY_DN19990_c0_g1_i3.p1 TRINITY_DN19990_c0_g1~~TRINITY_DN19990_c0_g1_i3.p1  ORF type:complete len:388 (+),score=13.36 TRINITY_DN19990_c0_g1_i3:65-1228(+)
MFRSIFSTLYGSWLLLLHSVQPWIELLPSVWPITTRDEALDALNLTKFELELLPQWVSYFRVGPNMGDFSTVGKRRPDISLYGTTDVAYTLYFVGLLSELSPHDRQVWADTINSFQDPETGYYWPKKWEPVRVDWPWHPTMAALEILGLLGHAPKHPMTDIHRLLRNTSDWKPFMDRYVANSTNIWADSHTFVALPCIAYSSDPSQHFPFYDFFLDYMNNHSDPTTGYFSSRTADPMAMMAGQAHTSHLYTSWNKSWPNARQAVDSTLKLQKPTGMWNEPGLSNCLDLDGVYSLTRSAQLWNQTHPYRWHDVEQACWRYVTTVASQLLNPNNVLGNHSGWMANSHLMHGALAAVAECASSFPGLITTQRPWSTARGADAIRACDYAR